MPISADTGTKRELAEITIVDVLNTIEFPIQTSGQLLKRVVTEKRICSNQIFYDAVKGLLESRTIIKKKDGRISRYALKENEHLFGPTSREPTELDIFVLTEAKRLITTWVDQPFNWWIEYQEHLAPLYGKIGDVELEKIKDYMADLYGVDSTDFYEESDWELKKQEVTKVRSWCEQCARLFRLIRRLEIKRGLFFPRPWNRDGSVEESAYFGKVIFQKSDDSFPISTPSPSQWFQFYVDFLDEYEASRERSVELTSIKRHTESAPSKDKA